jgi:hypothetical protein
VVKKRLWVGTAAQVSPQFDDTPKHHLAWSPINPPILDQINTIKDTKGLFVVFCIIAVLMNYGQNTESNKKLESRVFYEGQMTPCRHF